MFELRKYQQEALDAIVQSEEKGIRRQLVVIPTGGGKTVIFSMLPKIRPNSTPMLVLAHRKELLTQAKEKIERANPELKVEIEQGTNRAGHADVVVASVPTLGRDGSQRIEKYSRDYFRTIITDEAHHAAAPTYRRVIDYFTPGNPLHVGVTATPQRGDNVRLTDVFDEIVYYKPIMELIEDGFLSGLVGYRVSSNADISGVATNAGDYVDSQLAEVIDTPERNALIVNAYQKLVPGKKCLVFCATVEHAKHVADAFRNASIDTGAVFGSTSSDERTSTLGAFSAGHIQVLVNVGVLTEGFDEPSVQAIILAKPTRSGLLYTQIVGRGTRLFEGKDHCVVIDISDATKGKKPQGLPTLIGLPPDFDCEGEDLLEVGKKFKELEEKSIGEAARVKSLAEIELAWKRIDLFMPPPPNPAAQEHSTLIWAAMGEDHYSVNVGSTEQVSISADALGRFHVVLHDRSANSTRELGVVEELREAFARSDKWIQNNRADAYKLLDSGAAWRGDPPTEKQVKFLKRKGIPVTSDMTKGLASQIIQKFIDANPRSKAQEAIIRRNKFKYKGPF